ncbi:hypothetical protein AOQ84DRAFT_375361 [Glonium stellatum]|uniref:Uncharacterized protein n=1 Tax=Glonium stellatum TaxID=574774 RepID=A0A8E2F447_9PEZI|nr:hypothetical protein AOQ84DRAFT_375361 [Glonium stellatum]
MALDLSAFDNDPTLYLYTSLTAGSSHIITATSRIETILKANKIPFVAVDTATDDRARQLSPSPPIHQSQGPVRGGMRHILMPMPVPISRASTTP